MKLSELTLTEKILKELDACEEAIEFIKKFNLIGFPLCRLGEVRGDHCRYVRWLKNYINSEFDNDGNITTKVYLTGDLYSGVNSVIRLPGSMMLETTFKYDDRGNKISEYASDGGWLKREYDEKDRIIKVEKSPDYWKTMEYDEHGNVSKTVDSSGTIDTYKYNSRGDIIYFTGHDGYWGRYEYDDHGNEILFEDSCSFWQKSKYDDHGRILRMDDSNGSWIEWEYDEHGNEIRYVKNYDFIVYEETHQYNDHNDLVRCEFSNGYRRKCEYDDQNRLISESITECDETCHIHYEYYDNSQLREVYTDMADVLIIPKF